MSGEQQVAETGTKPFGWNGLVCRIPVEWDVASVSGSRKSGYFAFDDEQDRRLEIKFERAGRFRAPDVDRTLSNYFAGLRKKMKSGPGLEIEEGVRVDGVETMPGEYRVRPYGWQAEAVTRGLIWHCNVCNRIVIAECRARKNRVNTREMARILTSIRCHENDDTALWAVFDLEVRIPEEMELQLSRLQAGLISLSFFVKNRRLVVDRLGMGQAVLKHSSLDRYVRDVHYKKLRRVNLRFLPGVWGGAEGFSIEGEKKRFYHWIPRLGPKLREWRGADHIAGRVWFDATSNRILIIRAEGPGCVDLADQVAASIRTHIDGASAGGGR